MKKILFAFLLISFVSVGKLLAVPPVLHSYFVELDGNCGERQQIVGDQAGAKHGASSDGRNPKAAQNALFAESHQLDAEAPKAAHDGQREHHGQ